MKQSRTIILPILTALSLLLSCSPQRKQYTIGISQCSEDIWREKQNAEMRMASYFHDNVRLCFATANDSDERQVSQIDSLVDTGIDLLIVAPNQVNTINPAIDRAYDRGIPVIVFERKTNTEKYSAYIGADNYEMGHIMGEYIASQINHRGNVMEIMGLQGSSPAIERHKGFADALAAYPDIHIVATLQGDWTEESAYEATRQWINASPQPSPKGRESGYTPSGRSEGLKINYVFGQNDRMAIGARRALNDELRTKNEGFPKFCGIDGLPGLGGGIQLVEDSILNATYLYPTHGDQLLDLAIDILEGKPYEKETLLMSALVTSENAHVMRMLSDEITHQSDYLDRLHKQAVEYLQVVHTQRAVLILATGVIVLLILVIFLFYLYHQGKINLRRQRVVSTLWNMEGTASVPPTSLTPAQLPSRPLVSRGAETPKEEGSDNSQEHKQEEKESTPLSPWKGGGGEAPFITRFKEAVESRLSDSELSIEELAADMNLSRVQLYRKVKAISGSSPVELLRTARLNRGYQLLLTTDKTISEVAYEVGFTAPSYFTKCFKDEFGISPSELSNPV